MLSLDPQRYFFHLLSKLFSFISISILTLYAILSEAERQIGGSEPKSRVIQRSRMKRRPGGQAGESDGPKHVAWVDKWWLCSPNRWHCSTLWTCIQCSCRDFWHKDKNVQEVSQHIVHKCLEDLPGIGKESQIFKMTQQDIKHHFPFILLPDALWRSSLAKIFAQWRGFNSWIDEK